MNDIRRCPECGSPIPSGAPGGMCPKCLLAAGLESRGGPAGVAATQASPKPSGGFVPPEPQELAARFPQLEILELLGKGGMGAVYKARQRELDRLVAVKILPPEISRDPAFAERFTREARALARLSHPNIVGVYDFGQTKAPAVHALGSSETPLFYIVMEYVDGVNLRQAIQAGSIAPKEALAVVPQICAALQFAHDEGVVHRDIKPENILVDKRGRVKIADFGLAKIMESAGNESPANLAQLTATHQVMGTLRYMAPEQLEGTHTVDHRADIYSLGVVFYELLTGELPIGRFAAPSKKVQIDVRLDEVVLRALEKEPELRWQHASDVRTEVEAIVGDMPIAAQSIAAALPSRSLSGRTPATADRVSRGSGLLLLVTAIPTALLIVIANRFGGAFLDSLRGHDGRVVELGGEWGIGSTTQSVQLAIVLISCGLFALMLSGIVLTLHRWALASAERMTDPRAKALILVRGPAIGLMVMTCGVAALGGVFFLWAFGDAWFGPSNRSLPSGDPPPADMPVWMSIGGVVGAAYWVFGLFRIWVAAVELLALKSRLSADEVASRAMLPYMNALVFLPVALWVQAVLARDDVRGAFPLEPEKQAEPEQSTLPAAGPRFSRTAIVGAVWAPLFVALFAVMFTWHQSTGIAGASSPPPRPSLWLLVPLGVATLLGVAAPFGTTILGFVAIGQIRRSEGKLHGLPLAVADAILYPLLLLDGLIVTAVVVVFAIVTGSEPGPSNAAVAIAFPMIALVDFWIARVTWRAASGATRGIAMPRMEANSVSASRASASSASDQRRRVGGAVILVCASLQVVSAIIATLFLLGVFGDPADCDTFFQDTEARWLLLLGQAIAFILGMWSGVGCLALKTTGEAKMARSGGKALLVPLTPSWIVTCVPTLWAAGLLKE